MAREDAEREGASRGVSRTRRARGARTDGLARHAPEPAGDDGNVLGPERHGHHPEGDHDLAHAEPERHRERARRRKTREPRRRGALLRS